MSGTFAHSRSLSYPIVCARLTRQPPVLLLEHPGERTHIAFGSVALHGIAEQSRVLRPARVARGRRLANRRPPRCELHAGYGLPADRKQHLWKMRCRHSSSSSATSRHLRRVRRQLLGVGNGLPWASLCQQRSSAAPRPVVLGNGGGRIGCGIRLAAQRVDNGGA